MLHDPVSQAWISCLQVLRLHRSMPTATPVVVGGYTMILVWYHVSLFVRSLHKPWSQRKHHVCIKAASAIILNYITLVQVNPRYISLFIIPIIMLVFIGALFIKAPVPVYYEYYYYPHEEDGGSQKCDQDKKVEVHVTGCSEISCRPLEEDGCSLKSDQDEKVEVHATGCSEISCQPLQEDGSSLKCNQEKNVEVHPEYHLLEDLLQEDGSSLKCDQDKKVEVHATGCSEISCQPLEDGSSLKCNQEKKVQVPPVCQWLEDLVLEDGSSLKCYQDAIVAEHTESECSEISCNQLEGDGSGAILSADEALFLTAALSGWILCWIEADSGLVVSQFLLFLSSSMGQLSMMLASLPYELLPAFEVIHKASLLVVLLTAHTMAVEALGDDAVLVFLPELVAALVWVTIYLGHGGSSTLRTVESVLRKAAIPVRAIVPVILAYVVYTQENLKHESDGAMNNMLSSYRYLLVVCSFFVILPFLCLFALRQCFGQTEAGPSSELEGAIRLLSFCRDILCGRGFACLVVYPLAVVPLRLQLQGLAKDKWRDFFTAAYDVVSKFMA